MPSHISRFLSREQAGWIEYATRGLDIFALLWSSAFITVFSPSAPQLNSVWVLLILVNMFINMLTFQQANLYRSWRGRPYSDQFSQLVLAWGGASLITGLVWLLLDLTRVLNLTSLLAWFVVTLVTIVILRSVLYGGIRRFRKRGINSKKVLLYGAGRLGQSIATQTERSPETGFQIVGFVDDNPELKGKSINGIPVVGSLADLRETPLDYEIEEIWVALPLSATP
jgi:putative colanic acid biosynthesis UDP-glucose lipid carrier transferase